MASRSTILRAISRTTLSNSRTAPTTSTRTTNSSPAASHSIRLNSALFRQSRISPSPAPPTSRFLRRELISMLPIHTAIASACLVSKLPSDASTSLEGRFANYLSPI